MRPSVLIDGRIFRQAAVNCIAEYGRRADGSPPYIALSSIDRRKQVLLLSLSTYVKNTLKKGVI